MIETKELIIQVPDGYEIDREKSTFENIIFKKKEERKWRDNKSATLKGYYVGLSGHVVKGPTTYYNERSNYNIFATEKQAKSALAMARISQIMANDVRFGGPVTDGEWKNGSIKYVLIRDGNEICYTHHYNMYCFLAFHTDEQRELFLKENEDLIKDYLMID